MHHVPVARKLISLLEGWLVAQLLAVHCLLLLQRMLCSWSALPLPSDRLYLYLSFIISAGDTVFDSVCLFVYLSTTLRKEL